MWFRSRVQQLAGLGLGDQTRIGERALWGKRAVWVSREEAVSLVLGHTRLVAHSTRGTTLGGE